MTLEEIKALVLVANFPATEITETPNTYDSKSGNKWWQLTTIWGTVIVGWRYRVINIDFTGLGVSFPDLTPDSTDKGDKYVHAWSMADAAKYLCALHIRIREHHIRAPKLEHIAEVTTEQKVPGFIINRVTGSKEFHELVDAEWMREQKSAEEHAERMKRFEEKRNVTK